MRLCALAESSTEKSAARDITLVLLSRSPVLTTYIKSLITVLHFSLPGRICLNVFKRVFKHL